MSFGSMMSSNQLILYHPLLLLPSIFPFIRVFSNESVLLIRWPKYWSFSFSISPSNEYLGLISSSIIYIPLVLYAHTHTHTQTHTHTLIYLSKTIWHGTHILKDILDNIKFQGHFHVEQMSYRCFALDQISRIFWHGPNVLWIFFDRINDYLLDRTKRFSSIVFDSIHKFRHSMGVLEHIPCR